jgi:catechol 2,3-dioxygenase-like lactoylglutathione lyase family enzyme
MAIDSIQSLTLLVSDQASALSFYTDVLGLAVKADRPFGDARWIEVWAGAGTSIILHPPFAGTAAGATEGTVLGTNDITATVAALRDAGVPVDGPDDVPWGKQATFADPDGNGFVLIG